MVIADIRIALFIGYSYPSETLIPYPYPNYSRIIRSEKYPYSFFSGADGNYPRTRFSLERMEIIHSVYILTYL